uniref:XrtA system polysaccharide deacetylase n=1 Tax=Thaumasiovibrio occultus TaxID=1891184 RepID=UPI00192D1994|nr:XrtA system polysaccharide deacetylase [Thaumasiovibrio occultus]
MEDKTLNTQSIQSTRAMTSSISGATPPKLAMTIDVEDYFHVTALEAKVSPSDWGTTCPLRVNNSFAKLLDVLEQKETRSTLFILGWVAERCPDLIRRAAEAGHEIASHGWSHQRVTQLMPTEFRAEAINSKRLLEDLTGQAVVGFRAPSFSINASNTWAFNILAEAGYLYSSSTYPVHHDLYGTPEWPRFAHQRPEGILEIPIPALPWGKHLIPIGGGGFFRLYPYALTRYFIRAFLKSTGQPYSFYCHPWEFDPDQPRVKGIGFTAALRHYLNLSQTEPRFARLLDDFDWSTIRDVYQLSGEYVHEQPNQLQVS